MNARGRRSRRIRGPGITRNALAEPGAPRASPQPVLRTNLPVLACASLLAACTNAAELACRDDFETENVCRAEAGVETCDIPKQQPCATALSSLGDDQAASRAGAGRGPARRHDASVGVPFR